MLARNEEDSGVFNDDGSGREALMAGAEIPRPPVHRITWVQLALLVLASLLSADDRQELLLIRCLVVASSPLCHRHILLGTRLGGAAHDQPKT